jgi:hypothetical protein
MILQFVVKAFEEESSLLLPEIYDRYKLLLHKNDLNIVIDSDKDMSILLLITFLKTCAACSTRLSCFLFFFKSSVIREEIVFVNFKCCLEILY